MRSKVFSCLLSLSLMFFVGFGSNLTASAAEVSPDAQNEWFLLPFDKTYFDDASSNSLVGAFSESSGTYNGSFTGSGDWLVFSCSDTGAVMPSLESGHTYLLYYTFTIDSPATINVNRCVFRFDQSSVATSSGNLPIISSSVSYVNNTSTSTGICKFSTDSINGGNKFLSTASGLWFNLDTSHTCRGRTSWGIYLLDITDNSESEVNQIIAAINNQTSSLGGKIDGAADDIQQSIEDQYEGDPGSNFPVDDIITQHNEKMGVLSFSSEALMQVLGLLSPDQTLSSELVFPSMSLTIAGQRNRVQLWPEYRFDLNTLKQHWPDFIGIMQSLTTALVWIFVLRYCYRVFEKYFLAGGGS